MRGSPIDRLAHALAAGFLAASLAGCAAGLSGPAVAPGAPATPADTWKPPAGVALPPASAEPAPTATVPAIPPELAARRSALTLADLLDLALRNNTQTQQTWAQARSAAAALGVERGARWPVVALDATASSFRFAGGSRAAFGSTGGTTGSGGSSALSGGLAGAAATSGGGSSGGGLASAAFKQSSIGPNLAASWVLWDSGGRPAAIEEARQALIAADFTHNQAIADVLLAVQDEYYRYVSTRALLESQQASVKEFSTALDAATARHDAGLATIADVLQAKTALSQALLGQQQLEGQVRVIRGSLATALGLPASAAASDFDVAKPTDTPAVTETLADVDRFIERAERDRPELAAARSRLAESEAHIRRTVAASHPSLVTNTSVGRSFIDRSRDGNDGLTTYNATISLHIPVWSGRTNEYNRLRAEEDARAARARLESVRQQVILDVWTSYTDVQTAGRRVATADDLLESARQNEEVATARYKAGVGGILDLLTAQQQLESARASQVQAHADWSFALARLAHDTGAAGLLDPRAPAPAAPSGAGAAPPPSGADDRAGTTSMTGDLPAGGETPQAGSSGTTDPLPSSSNRMNP